jgi:hypothetical protein
MSTKTIQAPILLGGAGKDFLASLRKNMDVVEIIGLLISTNGTKEEWENAMESIPWKELAPDAVRNIALETHEDWYGCLILRKILHLNILHFEDFIKMSENWKNHDFFLTQDVMFKCHEVAKYCRHPLLGRIISARIANSGYPSWYSQRASFD